MKVVDMIIATQARKPNSSIYSTGGVVLMLRKNVRDGSEGDSMGKFQKVNWLEMFIRMLYACCE